MHLLLLLSVVGVVSSQTCTKGQFYNDGGGNILAKVGDGQCLGPSNGRVLNREVCICGCGFVPFPLYIKFFTVSSAPNALPFVFSVHVCRA